MATKSMFNRTNLIDAVFTTNLANLASVEGKLIQNVPSKRMQYTELFKTLIKKSKLLDQCRILFATSIT